MFYTRIYVNICVFCLYVEESTGLGSVVKYIGSRIYLFVCVSVRDK